MPKGKTPKMGKGQAHTHPRLARISVCLRFSFYGGLSPIRQDSDPILLSWEIRISHPLVTDLFSQMNQVLDAMFERKVQPGDYIIRQGDDGDNFYVIES